MASVSPERLRSELVRLAHRGGDVREFALGASRALARAVPFDGICVVTLDPATLLPTGEVVENGLPVAARHRMAEIEVRGEDFNPFAALARAPRPVATLSAATRRDLDRSERHRELKRPNGFGDELRAALRSDATTWGALTLLRASDDRHFAERDAALVASVSDVLAEGLRRALLLSAMSGDDGEEAAGFVLLDAANAVTATDAAARRWLAALREPGGDDPLPQVVAAVASRARGIGDGTAAADVAARARVRTAAGHWLLVRGSALGEGSTVVVIEPVGPRDLAPLIAGAYGLTERERAVTELVARGHPTSAIAQRLHLSPWTVQDHLKSIFEKVGVSTRGELIARVFLDRRGPRLIS